jgi:hypothetical protein
MDFSGKTAAELREIQRILKDVIRNTPGAGNAKAENARLLAEELKPFNDSIEAAKTAYESKGFIVEIKISKKGLISKWSLKRGNTVEAEKGMSPQEFQSIFSKLNDNQFSAKDIKKALIASGIGARKLQPTLGIALNNKNPLCHFAKVEGTDKGGTLYYKVK